MMKQSRIDEVTRTWREGNKRTRLALEKIKPAEQVLNPIHVVECNEGNGLVRYECTVMFGKRRRIRFTFSFPTQPEAAAKAEELRAAGYGTAIVNGPIRLPTGGGDEPGA